MEERYFMRQILHTIILGSTRNFQSLLGITSGLWTPIYFYAFLKIFQSVAVSNPRYRRSRSAGVMVDHQAANAVPTNTIMQPSNLKKKRSVTKLSEKDLLDPKTSNYALTTQEQDSDGGIVTTIYKVC